MVVSLNETIENTIISALKAEFTEYDVESFPADFKKYTFTSPVGCLLVKFLQTDFSQQTTIWEVEQSTTTKFSIIAGYRGLSCYKEVHEPQQRLKNVIQGLEILGRKIILEKEQFLAEIDTDLYCGLTCKLEHIQDY